MSVVGAQVDGLPFLASLDLSTLRLCSMLASLTFTIIFLTLWRGRANHLHYAHWAASLILYAIALAGLEWISRPEDLTIRLLLLTCLTASNIPVATGVRRFAGRPLWRWWMAIPPAVTLAGFVIPRLVGGLGLPGTTESETAFASIGLALGMGVFGVDIMRQADRAVAGGYGGRIAGLAMIAYIPCYLFSIAGELLHFATPVTLALTALLSDQLLLMLLNLALLAIPAEAAVDELRKGAWRDGLTGVYNRAWLASRSREFLKPGTWLAHIDVDHFKAINDRFGHATGDATLVALANALVAAAQNSRVQFAGQVVRMGGDEFLVILPNASLQIAQRLAQNVRTTIRHIEPFDWTVSIGLSVVEAHDLSLDHVVERADSQLYLAKRGGRDRVHAA